MAIFTGLTDYLGRVIRPILGKYATGDYREVMVDENGYLKVVRANEEMEGGTPAGVNVGTDSTEILNEDTSRRGAIIVNDSDTTIYLAIGKTAVAHKGIRLNAEGGATDEAYISVAVMRHIEITNPVDHLTTWPWST